MKIALIISSLGPGGAERALTGLANYWAQQGQRVFLYTFSGNEAVPFYPLDKNITLCNLNVMTPEEPGFWGRWIFLGRRIRVLRQALKSLNPDFILSFMDLVNIQVILASWGFFKKVVVCERTNPFLRPLSVINKILRRVCYPRVRLAVQTPEIGDYFHFMKKEKISVIPNVIGPLPPLIKRPRGNVLVAVGCLRLYKGFDLLIQAFAALHTDFPGHTLEIYGEGPDRNILENLISTHGLGTKVHLRGLTKEIDSLLQTAGVFVFPSRFEGFPNALAEALAMGAPCLASDTPGCDVLIEHDKNGLLFESENVEALEAGLRRLLHDAGLRERLSKEAVLVRDRFSPEKIYPLWDRLLPTQASDQIQD